MRGELPASIVGWRTRCCIGRAAWIAVAPGRGAGSVYTAVVGRRAHRSWRGAGSVRLRLPKEGLCPSCCRWPPSLTRDAAGVPRRPAAAQQGNPLPRRSADDRGDRHPDAPCRRRHPRPPPARPDRGAVARWPADLRGARARRGRPRRAPRFAAGTPRQGWPPPRGRHQLCCGLRNRDSGHSDHGRYQSSPERQSERAKLSQFLDAGHSHSTHSPSSDPPGHQGRERNTAR